MQLSGVFVGRGFVAEGQLGISRRTLQKWLSRRAVEDKWNAK